MECCDPKDKGDWLGASSSGLEARRGLGEALESGRASGPLALDRRTFSAGVFIYSANASPGTALALGIQQ